VETASATYTVTYTLQAEGQYPPDMQPFNDPVDGTVIPSEITVVDETDVLTTSAQKFTFTGDGVTGTSVVADEVIVTIPGVVGTGGGDVVSSESEGTVTTDEIATFDGTTGKRIKGSATGAIITSLGQLVAPSITASFGSFQGQNVRLAGTTADVTLVERTFDATEESGNGKYWVRSALATGESQNRPYFTAEDGTHYDLTQGIGGGDVSSSEGSGDVSDTEVAVFDGITGKQIKGAGASIQVNSSGQMTVNSLVAQTGGVYCIDTVQVISLDGGEVMIMEWATGGPDPYTGPINPGGKFWVKSAASAGEAQNRPYFTANDGTTFDLSQGGTGSYSSIVDLNADISPDHVSNVHIQSSAPAVAVDGDIWIETT